MNVRLVNYGTNVRPVSVNFGNEKGLKFTPEELVETTKAIENGDYEGLIGQVLPIDKDSLDLKGDGAKTKLIACGASAAAFATTALSFRRAAPSVRRSIARILDKMKSKMGVAGNFNPSVVEKCRITIDNLAASNVAAKDDTFRLLAKYFGSKSTEATHSRAFAKLAGQQVDSKLVEYIRNIGSENGKSKLLKSVAALYAQGTSLEGIRLFAKKNGFSENDIKLIEDFIERMSSQDDNIKKLVGAISQESADKDLLKFVNTITDKNADKELLSLVLDVVNNSKPVLKFERFVKKYLGEKYSNKVLGALDKVGIRTDGDVADAAIAIGAATLAGREAGDIAEDRAQDVALKNVIRDFARVASTVTGAGADGILDA